jgi:phosphohistidine phosphatase
MPELLILRHAKSDWGTEAPTDFERPLNERGVRDADRMGAWLAEQRSAPAHVVSSPAERARQTVLRICRQIQFPVEDIVWDKRIYEASPVTLLSVLADIPEDADSAMIVGHNPGLELLAEHMTGSNIIPPPGQKPFPTTALAVLRFDNPWAGVEEGCAKMTSLSRPREIFNSN